MGVYVFECGNYIKVGHHAISSRRPNVYYRVAGRGFHSCLHPTELEGRLNISDIVLVAWYPSLTRRDEMHIHRTFTKRVGEFHAASERDAIMKRLDQLGSRSEVTDLERERAIVWAGKRGK